MEMQLLPVFRSLYTFYVKIQKILFPCRRTLALILTLSNDVVGYRFKNSNKFKYTIRLYSYEFSLFSSTILSY